MTEYLNFKNTDIPVRQRINISNETFFLEIQYRKFDDRLVCNLYDEFGKVLGLGEKMVFGVPLFDYLYKDDLGNINQKMPKKYIVPCTVDCKICDVNLINFSTKIFLFLRDVI